MSLQSVIFNGINQTLSITDANLTGMDGFSSMSFCFHTTLDSSNPNDTGFFQKIDGSNNRSFGLNFDNNSNRVDFFWYNTSDDLCIFRYSGFKTFWNEADENTFTFYGDFVAGTAQFSFNGNDVTPTQVGSTGTMNTSTADFEVGIFSTGYLKDNLSYLRFWDGELTQTQLDNELTSETAIVTTGLQADWSFDGTLDDSSGNSNNLTNNNSTDFDTQNPFNIEECLKLEQNNNQSAFITDANQVGLDPTGDYSFGGWFKPESQPTGGANDYHLAGKYFTTGNQRGYQFTYEWNSGTPRLAFYNSSDGAGGTALGGITQTLTDNTWYFVAVSCDISAGEAEIFVKPLGGSMVSIGTITGLATSQFNSTAHFSIGGRTQNNNTYSDGRFAYWRFFSKLMTLSEWDTESDSTTAQATNNEADWSLNGDLLDSSANSNDLTNNNSATFLNDNPLEDAVAPVVTFNNFLGFSRL